MELSKNYIPATIEDKWYKHWLAKNYFTSKPDDRKAYTIVIPPPNITGVLHMGHTLNETVQDILIRKARMSGYNACWVPGSDHASIATEAKVVGLLKERGIEKNNLPREEFLKYAFEWKEKYGNIIYSQIAKLGCSVDWNRTTFTMDDHYYKAVIKVFVDLYNKGLIYRGARMINWDPAAKTALSDEEVEHKEIEGKLYYIKYEIASPNPSRGGASHATEPSHKNSKFATKINDFISPSPVRMDSFGGGPQGEAIIIATQRPETIMGDTAVCANPNDERYQYLKGKNVLVPLIDKAVPVIFDDYVDKDFGTGILKITPAHDINDYNIGLKHNLPVVDTLNEDGTMSEAAQIYIGEDRFVVRKKIVEELRQKGLLVKEEEYTTRIGYSQRTNVVVEPKISTQWFLKMKELAQPALEAVASGNVSIHPGDKFNATYKYWLENVKDWCISRQLWWGQQIPAWYDEEGNVFVAETEGEARKAMSDQRSAISNERSAISDQQSAMSNQQSAISDQQSAISNEQSAISNQQSAISDQQSAISNEQSAISNQQSAISNQQSAISDQQSAISNEQSAISNQQSAISNQQSAMSKVGSKLKAQSSKLVRDEDVLDTWFSSWLWPIEVFNGITSPGNDEIKYYYPASVLVTGQDIIFFWVSRMIMAGMEYMHEKPFSDVYFTGMVRDKLGRKMSKQLGNSPNLLELIKEYGADAVRFGIMISSPAGNDLLFDESSLEQGKHFNNKLWNALKLVKMWEGKIKGNGQQAINNIQTLNSDFATKWFQNRLNEARIEVDKLMKEFRLSEALKTIYSLIWDDYCSWFLEWIKPDFGKAIDKTLFDSAVIFFEDILQILHPYMPFITEEIYHLLKEREDDLTIKQFADTVLPDEEILLLGNKLKHIITSIRDAKNKNNIKPKETIRLYIETHEKSSYDSFLQILSGQVNAEFIKFNIPPENASITIVAGKEKIFIETNIEIDVAAQKEKLLKDLDYLKGFLNTVDRKLSNDKFVQNAKPQVIELERKKKSDAQEKITMIEESLSAIN